MFKGLVFLGAIGNASQTSWTTKIKLPETDVIFMLDTGAEVTEEVSKNLEVAKLQKPSKMLYSPSDQKLDVVGEFEGTVSVIPTLTRKTSLLFAGFVTIC